LNPADQHTSFFSVCRSVTPFLQSLHHPAPKSYAVASLLLTLLPSIPLLVVLSLPHGLSTPAFDIYFGAISNRVFLDWTAAGCGRTVEYFLVAQAKKTDSAAECSAVKALLRRPVT
jgi:hypothetical protein